MKYLVILDAGHGIDTPDKRSPIWPDGRQLFEYEFNRDVVNRIVSYLEKNGIDWRKVYDEVEDTPLSERVKLANRFAKDVDKCLYLSVHANLGGGSGWEVFTSVGQDDSDKYAIVFYEEMKKQFPSFKFRINMEDGDVDKEAQFYVLRKTEMPAVLTENFFMDTLVPDCELIMSSEGRQKIADAHVSAIMRIINMWDNE